MKTGVFLVCGFLVALFALRNVRRVHTSSTLTGRNNLLLIAHPDDEAMFFAPTLLCLLDSVVILCLSDGGYHGMGETRRKEMRRLGRYLNVKTLVLDFVDNEDWDPRLISIVLKAFRRVYKFERVYTFDEGGVSGHKNHIACFNGARIFTRKTGIPSFYLKSKGLVEKYFLDLNVGKTSVFTSMKDFLVPIKMMLIHRSQILWYRAIYVLASNYMQYNEYAT